DRRRARRDDHEPARLHRDAAGRDLADAPPRQFGGNERTGDGRGLMTRAEQERRARQMRAGMLHLDGRSTKQIAEREVISYWKAYSMLFGDLAHGDRYPVWKINKTLCRLRE